MADDISALSKDLVGLKKKKKKAPINTLDTGDLLAELAHVPVPEPENAATEGNQEPATGGSLESDLFGKKKRKLGKKKIESSVAPAVQETTPTSHTQSLSDDVSTDDVLSGSQVPPSQKRVQIKENLEDYAQGADSELYSLPLKKKRRRENVTFEGFDIEDVHTAAVEGVAGEDPAEGGDEAADLRQSRPWLASERDYSYEELLERAFKLITRHNPNMMAAGGKQKVVMKPPQVIRAGRKTSFANFADICKMLHREPKHLMAFLMAELGTSGSVDGNNQLIIKGIFQQKNVESVLKKYIKEYVTCHTCRSPDTILQREIRLTFLQCERCGSRCSVQNIRTGFQAVTNRAQARLRQT